jgi:hypothetical protein
MPDFDDVSMSDGDEKTEATRPGGKRSKLVHVKTEPDETDSTLANSLAGLNLRSTAFQQFAKLNNNADFLLADLENSNNQEIHWVTGEKWGRQFEAKNSRKPTTRDTEKALKIRVDDDFNVFPIPQWVGQIKDPDNPKRELEYHEKVRRAEHELKRNGLGEELYLGTTNGGKALPLKEQWYETPGGQRKRTYNYLHPTHAGETIGDVTQFLPSGEVKSYSLSKEQVTAIKSIPDFEASKGGGFFAYHGTNHIGRSSLYLEGTEPEKPNAALNRLRAFHGLPVEHNLDLPPAVFTMGDLLADTRSVVSETNRKANPEVAMALEQGARIYATEVLVRAPNGRSYLTPQFAHTDNPEHYSKMMKEAGISDKFGKYELAWREKQQQRSKGDVYARRGPNGILTASQGITLGKDQTIASTFKPRDIQIANEDSSGRKTGNFRSMEEVLEKGLTVSQDVYDALHTDNTGKVRPKLSPEEYSGVKVQKLDFAKSRSDWSPGRDSGSKPNSTGRNFENRRDRGGAGNSL